MRNRDVFIAHDLADKHVKQHNSMNSNLRDLKKEMAKVKDDMKIIKENVEWIAQKLNSLQLQ